MPPPWSERETSRFPANEVARDATSAAAREKASERSRGGVEPAEGAGAPANHPSSQTRTSAPIAARDARRQRLTAAPVPRSRPRP